MNLIKRIKAYLRRFIFKFKKQSISVISASISADGSLIDIRYNISKSDKINNNEKVFLIDEGTNSNLPAVSAAKNGLKRTNHNLKGMLLFNNKGFRVQPGSFVTLVFGNIKIEHIKID